MALTQAQLQQVVAFARTNRLGAEDMCAVLELALMTPFIDANSGIQMVSLQSTVDGVQRVVGFEAAQKLLEYFSKKAGSGLVSQRVEFSTPNWYPGQLS